MGIPLIISKECIVMWWSPANEIPIVVAGERRIRVHTLAVPVTNKLSDVYAYADQEGIASLLSKMGKRNCKDVLTLLIQPKQGLCSQKIALCFLPYFAIFQLLH